MPIFYTAISQYCQDHGIAGDDFRRFLTFINAIDSEYREMSEDALKAAREKGAGGKAQVEHS